MRRTSRIYFTNSVNPQKLIKISKFLQDYRNALNYSIALFWARKDFDNHLSPKEVTDRIIGRFGYGVVFAQAATKQAKEIVLSQKERKEKTMPRVKSYSAQLNMNFGKIQSFKGSFDFCVPLKAGLSGKMRQSLIIPFNKTKHLNKFLDNGWTIGNSFRLGKNDNGIYTDIIVEKERPPLKKEGKLIGIDRGYRVPLAASDGQIIGKDLKQKIESLGYRRKTAHYLIETEMNRAIKKLNLTHIHSIAMEDLDKVKHYSRGKFSRRVNRLLSFWLYKKLGNRLQQICEENGVRIILKDPSYTSQRCYLCGNIDRRNRRGDKFLCLKCGHADDADHNASMNLEYLGMTGAYSLRSINKVLEANRGT